MPPLTSSSPLLAPTLLGMALLGMATGGALRAAATQAPAPAPPVGVSATVAVIGFLPSPSRAELEVTLYNRSEVAVRLEQVTAQVEGGTTITRRDGTDVPAGQLTRVVTEAGLGCPTTGRLQVRLTLLDPADPARPETTTVQATPTGDLPGSDLCASADMVLPAQAPAADPARATRVGYHGSTARVRAADLPAGRVLMARAGSWPVLDQAVTVLADGTADLVLRSDHVRCSAETRGQPVPTVLTLVVHTDGTQGDLRRSLPLGPALARWLLAGPSSGCPT